MEDKEVVEGLKVTSSIVTDYEFRSNLDGLSGQSATHPFADCKCTQCNRNKPRAEQTPCEDRTVEFNMIQHEEWKTKGKKDEKKANQFFNCVREPLLPKSFTNEKKKIAIFHICNGLGNRDISHLEGELLDFDINDAYESVVPKQEGCDGSFWRYIEKKKVMISTNMKIMPMKIIPRNS